MQQTEITWPKEDTAFLIIHGVGPHKPFEALDDFAGNFLHALQARIKKVDKNLKVKCRHEVLRHNDWIESYIAAYVDGIEGMRRLDFYEYYWDCYMTRDITVRELIDWVDKISNGGKYFYRYQMPHLAKQYGKDKVDLFNDGEFQGYAALLNRSVVIQLLIRLITYSPLRFIAERLSQWASLKDLVIYTTSDVRSQNYEIRRKILDGAVEELKLLLKSDWRYDQIIVVGHSLGSVIAYDALDRIQQDMNVPNDPKAVPTSKIKGLVTLGSPLDKVAFFFHEHIPKENSIQRAILAHLHNFKRRPLTTDKGPQVSLLDKIAFFFHLKRRPSTKGKDFKDIADPFKQGLNAKWLNFYHRKDLIGGHLDAYDLAPKDNVECTMELPHVGAHSCYWQLRGEVHDKIIECFFKP